MPVCSGLVTIVYGRKGNNERFDPAYEKRLKARQPDKKSTGGTATEKTVNQGLDLSAPVSQEEAKKRRNAISPEKGADPFTRGHGAFLDECHNGESAPERAWQSAEYLDLCEF